MPSSPGQCLAAGKGRAVDTAGSGVAGGAFDDAAQGRLGVFGEAAGRFVRIPAGERYGRPVTAAVVDYRLVELRGQGGMAQLWQAHDIPNDRAVAVKVLRPEADLDTWIDPTDRHRGRIELHARFRREGALLAELHHPGIPELYHQGMHHGRPFLIMELIDGLSLRQFQEKYRPLPLSAAMAIAAHIAEALECAHRIPVVHRDLKPENVVLAEDGTAVLIDFGIALPMRPGVTRYTAPGATPGSMGYMAPEQLLEQRVSTKTDLYAFGCVLFELLTGRPPFVVEADRSVVFQHLHILPPPVSAHARNVPVAVEELTDRLLAKNPGDRPCDIEVVIDALRPFLPAVGAPAPSPRLVPDPTGPLRVPQRQAGRVPQAPAPPTIPPPAARSHRRDQWLDPAPMAVALRQAQEELHNDGPGVATARLAALLAPCRRQWGIRTPLVARIQLTCADASRIAGDYQRAAEHYQELIEELANLSAPDIRTVVLEARVGAAECLVPFGDTAAAFDAWAAVACEVAGLRERPAEVLARCREFGLELAELGRAAEAAELLAALSGR